MAAGLIDSRVDSSIFGTSKFTKEDDDSLKENIFTNIDEMISDTLNEKDENPSSNDENSNDQDYEDDDEEDEDDDDEDEEDDDDEDEEDNKK
jgi:hypothetical protein